MLYYRSVKVSYKKIHTHTYQSFLFLIIQLSYSFTLTIFIITNNLSVKA